MFWFHLKENNVFLVRGDFFCQLGDVSFMNCNLSVLAKVSLKLLSFSFVGSNSANIFKPIRIREACKHRLISGCRFSPPEYSIGNEFRPESNVVLHM